jgi:hypothetical protein
MAVVVVPVVVGAEEALVWLLAALGIYAGAKAIPKVIPKIKEKCDEPDHRGRIQAQGGGLERSEPWAQTFPPPTAQGLAQLTALYASLSSTDQKIRAQPCAQIRTKIEIGNIFAPFSQSFYAPPNLQSKRGDLRMDLEVRKGWAFV